jgi:hypothetical protein
MSDEVFLTNKKSLLNSVATKYDQNYYSEANSIANTIETTYGFQNKISLPSVGFGTSSQLNMPADSFLGDVILHLQLPRTVANQSLCRGWGMASLASVQFLLGGSNSTSLVLQDHSIAQALFCQAETKEKRSELLHNWGEEQLGVMPVPAGEDAPTVDAYVLIPLPFSAICDKLPIDCTLLSSPIQLTFNFKQANAIYGGSAVTPNGFLKAELLMRTGKLSNQALSLRSAQIAHPSLRAPYPWVYAQRFQSAPFQGARESDGLQACSVLLSGFINSDLLGICIGLIKDSDVFPNGGNSPNPFNYADISNLLVSFNGSTLFNFPNLSSRACMHLVGQQQAPGFECSVIDPGTISPFISRPRDAFPVVLNFARGQAACLPAEILNTWRIPAQQILCQFNTPLGAGTTYRLYATYFYNSVVVMQNGTSDVVVG